ncbi:hypothetical protein NON20_18285 [Synechocystis sp. B12]|nr:hypothetical protein NON20_18285 [Synechocystis sp. B12]
MAMDDTDDQRADFDQSMLALAKANLVVPLFSGDRLWGYCRCISVMGPGCGKVRTSSLPSKLPST